MPIFVYGIHHKTAPIAIREQVALSEQDLPEALGHLLKSGQIQEAVILSTCNRTEIYCEAQSPEALEAWFGPFQDYVEMWMGADAVIHLMQVASGLDSMVLGEPQILGQMKRAYALAQEAGSVGKYLSRLFQTTFKAAKHVRSHTGIGDHPVSVAYAAIKMAQRVFKSLSEQQVLLVGSGEMIELTARYLHESGVKHLSFANRTLEHAQRLALRYGGEALGLAALPEQLPLSDMVISATASELPIIGKGRIEAAMKMRKYKPMVLIDLAVPRDMEAEIKELDNVYLYDIDGLGSVVKANQQAREKAALQAKELIHAHTQEYLTWCSTQQAVHEIKAYRSHHEELRDQALAKAQKLIEAGKPVPDVLTNLAHLLTNQLLHLPTLKIKEVHLNNKESENIS
jgi:glutamyl-tRNA reductase